MNPYRFELLHLLRRRALIAVLVVAVLAGAFNYFAIEQSTPGETIEGAGFAYVAGGSYHVELWAVDIAGDPVPGVTVTLNATTQSTPPSVDFLGSQTSDAQGRVAFVVPIPPSPSSGLNVYVFATDPKLPRASIGGALEGGFGIGNATGPPPSPGARPTSINGPLLLVDQNYYSAFGRELVVWAEPGGAAPIGDRLITCELLGSNATPALTYNSTCAGSTDVLDLGPLTGPRTLLPDSGPPPLQVPRGDYVVTLAEIVNASGGVEYSSVGFQNGGGCGYYSCYDAPGGFGGAVATPYGPSSEGPGLLDSFSAGLELFVPLMALALAYWIYARPRLSGTLEPVLARPVTRRGLFLTRYAAIAVVLGGAAIGEVLLFDAGVSAILLEPLPAGYLAPLAGGLLIAALGFAGLVLLMAHVFRSTGPVLGIGIGLLLLFSLFWSTLVAAVALGGGLDPNSNAFVQFVLQAELAAPSQYPGIVSGLLTGTTQTGFSATYAAAGITGPAIAFWGGLWILLPFAATIWRLLGQD